MLYLYALLLILSGVVLAWFGQKKYGLSFAGSYFISTIALYLISVYPNQFSDYVENYPYLTYALGFAAIGALGMWIWTKFFTYLIAWEIIAGAMLIMVKSIVGDGQNTAAGIAVLILPIVAVYLLRNIIKKLAIGFFSGLVTAIGIMLIVLIEKFKSGEIFSEPPTYLLIILLLFIATGVGYQFSPYANSPESDS